MRRRNIKRANLIRKVTRELGKHASQDALPKEDDFKNLRKSEIQALESLMREKIYSIDLRKPEKKRFGIKSRFPNNSRYKEELMEYVNQWDPSLADLYLIPYKIMESLANYLEREGIINEERVKKDNENRCFSYSKKLKK